MPETRTGIGPAGARARVPSVAAAGERNGRSHWISGLITLWLGALVLGCSGGDSSPTTPAATPTSVQVTFEYQAATTIDPAVDFATCTPDGAVFPVHLHFTWIDWEERRPMTAQGSDRWTLIAGVPTERVLEIALHDPNTCLEGDVYVAPDDLFANGVRLTDVVNVQQGSGLSFTVRSDGTVEP